MDYKFVKLEQKPHRLDITLNNPPVNILTGAVMGELITVLREAAHDQSLRVVVLKGEGKAWSAGADVSEHLPNRFRQMLDTFTELCELVRAYPIPMVAAVHGNCLGGGCEVACLCDFVLASETARFGQPEIKVGVFPPAACAHFSRRIGLGRALEVVLTGDLYDAETARQMGLVTRVFPADKFAEEVDAFVAKLTANSGAVLRLAKHATIEAMNHRADKGARLVAEIYREQLMQTSDAAEGLGAFLEKRKADWKDR